MKKTATSVLALLLALGLTAPVMAQETTGDDTTTEDLGVDTGDTGVDADLGTDLGTDTDAGTDTDMSADVGTGTGDASADFMTRTGISFDQLVTDLRTQTDTTQVMTDLQNLSTETEVIVVRLSDLQGGAGENAAALEQTLTDRQAGLTDLHAAINANATVRGAIEAEGMMAEDVVAVHRLDDGRVIVVVDTAA